jgi:hypothetical protein
VRTPSPIDISQRSQPDRQRNSYSHWNTRKQLVALHLGTALAREIYEQDRDQGLLHMRFTEMLDSSEMFRLGVDDDV